MSTAASATRPMRCSRSAWRRSKAASARSPRPAARPRCTWRSPRWPAPAAHIVVELALYGGSHNLLALHAAALRHRDDASSSRATSTAGAPRSGRRRGCCSARRSATRAWTCSTSRRCRRIAHDAGVPLLVDSTFTTPWLMRPFDHGADLIFHSATKFLCGHGTVVGGVLVDGGRFDWSEAARFPELNQPYAGFHGMVFSRGERRSAPSCCARAARACATSAPA